MSADTIRTLIVDDVPRLRGLLSDALEEGEGFEVAGEAADGVEAIQQALDLTPDLVLLDLSMPRMDGLEALTEIRREVPVADVVVLSGFTSERMAAVAQDHGALAYVEKGRDPDELIRHLRDLVTDGTRPEPGSQPTDDPPQPPSENHVHVVGLDADSAKEVTTALHAARPGWELTHGREHRTNEPVPEATDVVVVAVGHCEGECQATLASLSARHPELPIVVAVPEVSEGCLQASLEAGATEVLDLEAVDADQLATEIRWARLVDERHRSRTRRLEMLAGTMAHDLRQPLRALDRYADWVQDGLEAGDADRLQTASEGLTRNVERAWRLIDSQLDYAKLTTKPPAAATIDPREALDQALADVEELVRRSGAQFEIGEMPAVSGVPDQLGVLFRNLVTNAIKYQAEDEAPHIRIDGRREGKDTVILVEDDGIGIDPDLQEEIFEPFRRLHAEQDYPGTGLGLAICREIVDQHGGSIDVDSEPGQGTTFTVRLPAPVEDEGS